MRYLSILSGLPTVDGGQHAPSLEQQPEVSARKLSSLLLWTGKQQKCILASYKKARSKKSISV